MDGIPNFQTAPATSNGVFNMAHRSHSGMLVDAPYASSMTFSNRSAAAATGGVTEYVDDELPLPSFFEIFGGRASHSNDSYPRTSSATDLGAAASGTGNTAVGPGIILQNGRNGYGNNNSNSSSSTDNRLSGIIAYGAFPHVPNVGAGLDGYSKDRGNGSGAHTRLGQHCRRGGAGQSATSGRDWANGDETVGCVQLSNPSAAFPLRLSHSIAALRMSLLRCLFLSIILI